MFKPLPLAIVVSMLGAASASAQQTAPQPAAPGPAKAGLYRDSITASGGLKSLYENVRGWVLNAAEKMPEEHYAFKPTPEVRSLFPHLQRRA